MESDSPGLVDFAIGLVNSVLNLPDGQVMIFEEFKLRKNCEINSARQKAFGASWNDVWASKCFLQLARMASCKSNFLCPLNIQRGKEGKRYLQQRILNYGVRGCTLYKQKGHPTILLVKLQPFFNFAKCNLDVCWPQYLRPFQRWQYIHMCM